MTKCLLVIAFAASMAFSGDHCFNCPSPWMHYVATGEIGYGDSGGSEASACAEAIANLKQVMAGGAGHRCCECENMLRNCPRKVEFTIGASTTQSGMDSSGDFWCIASFSSSFKVKCNNCWSLGGQSG